MGADKLLHYLSSLAITLMTIMVVGVIWGVVAGLILAIGKEVYDQIKYKGWCWWDLLADAAGIVTAVVWWMFFG